jgi:MSHA biogenesis protein MshP
MGAHFPYRQRGVSIVTAIFLIVILAGLAGFAARIFSVQQQSSGLDVQGSQAYAAAQSGIDWGAFQALRNGACAVTTNLAMPAGPLANFAVTVTCASTAHTESGNPATLYRLTATACNQPTGAGVCPNPAPGESYVERQVTATVEN